MIRFECDYLEGAHPRIMERLMATNMEQTRGYSEDTYCDQARELLRRICDAPRADVHFLVGGTQTNLTVIAAALRPYQGVLAAVTGHINVHETGAVEASGHKVLPLPSSDGKITAEQAEQVWQAHQDDASREHAVQPAMVYVSNPTENGTLYSKAELTAISEVCRKRGMLLFLDGARMGYGLAAPGNDLTLPDYARLCDVFYIGGTKVGALFGEAVIITDEGLKKDFRYMIKQRGGMLAKGRLLGLQFLTLFEDGLYDQISRQADELALRLRDGFAACGYSFLFPSVTNQQYPILPETVLDKLKKSYSFSFWERVDEKHSAVRFCTSWATTREQVEQLLRDLNAVSLTEK